MWGESGRFPLIYECIRLTLNYYTRVNNLNDKNLVHYAIQEQKKLNLNWYKNIEKLLKLDDDYMNRPSHLNNDELSDKLTLQPS